MPAKSHFDVIVLGLGGVGSAAIHHAASAGMRALGIDQYSPVHDKGSSHGHTRVIRHVEACVSAHLHVALQQGAVCRHEEVVQGWSIDNAHVIVQTTAGKYRADRLIVAAGPWSRRVLQSANLPLRVLRKHQYWLHTDGGGFDRDQGFPCFFFETSRGFFYGFPSIGGRGVKVARHSGGQCVPEPTGQDHPWDEQDFALVSEFVAKHLPGVTNSQKSHAGCYYTMTPSEHFIVDTLPREPQVTVVAGLSGHGFKFTSVLGEIAVGIARGEEQPFDLTPFRIAVK